MESCGADMRIIGEHTEQLKALKEGQVALQGELKEFRKENKEDVKELAGSIRQLAEATDKNTEARFDAIDKWHTSMSVDIAECMVRGKRNENWILWANRLILAGSASMIISFIWKHVTGG
jgi:hypothetical protein